jgi:hypothetical protein
MNANSGYNGYSMSNRAVEAYSNGEKPLSKWTKAEIISAVSEIDSDKAELLKSVKALTLKEKVLYCSSWHHTSSRYNKTNFYRIDEDFINGLTEEDIAEMALENRNEKKKSKTYKGDIFYIEWSGTRNYPKAEEKCLSNVNIEERGAFYYVTDDAGTELLKKKIGSNGTRVVNHIEEEEKRKAAAEREQFVREHSSAAALEFYDSIKDDCVYSNTNHIYKKGRKPSVCDYEAGLDKFFVKGEHRLYKGFVTGILRLETWNGTEWISEED